MALCGRSRSRLQALAERSPDRSPHRQDEPYRRALSGIYARLAATAARVRPRRDPAPRGRRARRPMRRRGVRGRSLDHRIARCCRTARARSRADGCANCGGPWTCSAFTSPASTCARTPTCTSASSRELFEKAAPGHRLRGACGRGARRRCCWRSCDTAPAGLALPRLFRRDRLRTRHRSRGRECAPAATARRGPQLRHLQGERLSDFSRSRCC